MSPQTFDCFSMYCCRFTISDVGKSLNPRDTVCIERIRGRVAFCSEEIVNCWATSNWKQEDMHRLQKHHDLWIPSVVTGVLGVFALLTLGFSDPCSTISLAIMRPNTFYL